jgi:hypothetical protein
MPTLVTERSVTIDAGVLAMEAAWSDWHDGFSSNVEQLALANSWRYLLEAHRALFVQTFVQFYARGLAAFQSKQYAIADNLPRAERLWLFHDFIEIRLPGRQRGQSLWNE